MSRVKTPQEIQAMKEGGAMLATVLAKVKAAAVPGISGKELSAIAAQELKALGGEPAFLGVPGGPGVPDFPDVLCVSISEEVQHGLPSDRVLVDGDIVNFDFGVKWKGLITDSGLTVAVGNVDKDGQRLLQGTEQALWDGLAEIRDGAHIRDVSSAIEDTLEDYGLGIVLELVGHGVGDHLHEEPEIPNYRIRGYDYVLKAGETIAVEPIATLGKGDIVFADDGWTILSKDGSYSAQFEHTVVVTETGYEILTQ